MYGYRANCLMYRKSPEIVYLLFAICCLLFAIVLIDINLSLIALFSFKTVRDFFFFRAICYIDRSAFDGIKFVVFLFLDKIVEINSFTFGRRCIDTSI